MKRAVAILVAVAIPLIIWIALRGGSDIKQNVVDGRAAEQGDVLGSERREAERIGSDANRQLEIGSESFAKDYESMKEKAKHDAAYAYALALKLMECQRLENSYEAVADVSSAPDVGEKTTDAMMGSVEKSFDRCKGLSTDQMASYADLLDFAAKSGVVEAQLNYSTILAGTINTQNAISDPEKIIEYKRKSIEYLNRAAATGDSRALLNLGLAYGDGILLDKNPKAAYSYLYAYGRSNPGKNVSGLLAQVESQLTAGQIASAQQEGEALYSRCCR